MDVKNELFFSFFFKNVPFFWHQFLWMFVNCRKSKRWIVFALFDNVFCVLYHIGIQFGVLCCQLRVRVISLWFFFVCDARHIIFILILRRFPPWVLWDKICSGFGEVSGRSAFAVAPVWPRSWGRCLVWSRGWPLRCSPLKSPCVVWRVYLVLAAYILYVIFIGWMCGCRVKAFSRRNLMFRKVEISGRKCVLITCL